MGVPAYRDCISLFCMLVLITVMGFTCHSTVHGQSGRSNVTYSESARWGNVSMSSTHAEVPVRGGYIPIEVTITPRKTPLTVEVNTSSGYTGRGRRQTTSRTVRLKGNRPYQFTIYHPVWGVSEEIDLYARRRDTDRRIHVGSLSWSANVRQTTPTILYISPPEQEQPGVGDKAHKITISPEGTWRDWKGYTAFDRVSMAYETVHQLNRSARQALLRWVANGGHLMLLHSPLNRLKQEQPAHLPVLDESERSGDNVMLSEHLFGVISLHKGAQQTDSVDLSTWPERFGWGQGNDGFTDPIVPNSLVIQELLEVPIVIGLLILLGFTILIGPVNYWYLKRNGQEARMLVTIPLLAILTTGLIFAWDIFKHGLGNDVRAQGIVRIDQRVKSAAFVNRYMLHMAISPGQLSFPNDASVSYLGRKTNSRDEIYVKSSDHRARSTADSGEAEVKYTNRGKKQMLSGSPVQSRTPVFLDERDSKPFRGRLVVERKGSDQLDVTNTLGFPIHHLLLVDQKNRYYAPVENRRKTLSTGESAKYKLIESRETKSDLNFFEQWKQYMLEEAGARDVSFEFAPAFRSPPERVRVTRYMGLTDQNQFGSMGVTSMQEHESTYLIQGTHWNAETDEEEK